MCKNSIGQNEFNNSDTIPVIENDYALNNNHNYPTNINYPELPDGIYFSNQFNEIKNDYAIQYEKEFNKNHDKHSNSIFNFNILKSSIQKTEIEYKE